MLMNVKGELIIVIKFIFIVKILLDYIFVYVRLVLSCGVMIVEVSIFIF